MENFGALKKLRIDWSQQYNLALVCPRALTSPPAVTLSK